MRRLSNPVTTMLDSFLAAAIESPIVDGRRRGPGGVVPVII